MGCGVCVSSCCCTRDGDRLAYWCPDETHSPDDIDEANVQSVSTNISSNIMCNPPPAVFFSTRVVLLYRLGEGGGNGPAVFCRIRPGHIVNAPGHLFTPAKSLRPGWRILAFLRLPYTKYGTILFANVRPCVLAMMPERSWIFGTQAPRRELLTPLNECLRTSIIRVVSGAADTVIIVLSGNVKS